MPPWPNDSTVNQKLDWLLDEIKNVEALILQLQGDLAVQIDILADLKFRVTGLEWRKE